MSKDINNGTKEILKATVSVEIIRYFANEWGIVLASIDKVKEGKPRLDKKGFLVIKGEMARPNNGGIYNIVAEYDPDPKWGDQYTLCSFYSAIEFGEDDERSQKKYLSSLFTDGQVNSMYDTLENPFEVLKNKDVKELIKVKGCGIKTAARWIEKFSNNYYMARIFTELDQYNLTNNMIKKLLHRYNNNPDLVIQKVTDNPYVLCNEVDGIGWKTADNLALAGGIGEFSEKRVAAYIEYYLDTCALNGYSWITPDELLGAILDNIGEEVEDETITKALHSLGDKIWSNDTKTKIGLRRYYEIERKIAEELMRIQQAESEIVYKDFEDAIKRLETKQGWNFTDEQISGIKVGLNNNVTLIQGYAGTGKSSLVSAIIEILRKYTYVQCALSGRASARMAEITGEEGYTIHRLLGYPAGKDEKKGMFVYHDENPLPYDIYILDEISMVDAFLFYYLLRAIPSGAKLICLGDPGQLESIGAGNIAYDMIHSPEIPTVSLTKIHRQAAASAIITESIKIRNGVHIIPKEWAGKEVRGQLQDLHLNCFSDKSNTYYEVMKEFMKEMDKDDFDIMESQIIVPVKHQGMACTYELNNAIQELWNPLERGMSEKTQFTNGKAYVLRVGDKVINTKNNYRTSPPIYNGNIGIIKDFYFDEDEDEFMTIDFTGIGEVAVPRQDWGAIELGYAITSHKSQGSQWKNVVFALDFSSYALLTRELLYTGITRAKNKCTLIAQTNALRMATCKAGVNKKQTHLQDCLYDIAHPKLIF